MRKLLSHLMASVCLTATAPTLAQPAPRIDVSGSSTMAPLVTALAQRFTALHPMVTVDVKASGSSRGIEDTRRGLVHVGMVSRTLGDGEADLTGFPIARDGVAVLVHADNPVARLTSAQLRDIHTGRITRWDQVGGGASPIKVIAREKGRGVMEVFMQHFAFKEGEIKAGKTIGDNRATIQAVRDDPGAITVYSLGDALRQTKRGTPVKMLWIDGITPSAHSVRSGDYPLLRSLTLVTAKLPRGHTKQFIDFCLSGEASSIVSAHDFVAYLD